MNVSSGIRTFILDHDREVDVSVFIHNVVACAGKLKHREVGRRSSRIVDSERRIRDRCAFGIDAENFPGPFVVQSETCENGSWSEQERVALAAIREAGLTGEETVRVPPEQSLVPAAGRRVCYHDADCVADMKIRRRRCAVTLESGEPFRRWWSLGEEEI